MSLDSGCVTADERERERERERESACRSVRVSECAHKKLRNEHLRWILFPSGLWVERESMAPLRPSGVAHQH